MSEPKFMLPTSPTGTWEDFSENEKTWIEFIRVISGGRDPKISPNRIRALRELLDSA
jgi:hypothetical protein